MKTSVSALAILFLMSTLVAAQLSQDVNSVYPRAESLYIDLHKNPELGFHEQRTAAELTQRMKSLGYEVTTGVGGTGIVAIMKNGTGPTVMMRTELDALPVQEKTGLPYASTVTRRTLPAKPSRLCMPAATTCTWPPGSRPRP